MMPNNETKTAPDPELKELLVLSVRWSGLYGYEENRCLELKRKVEARLSQLSAALRENQELRTKLRESQAYVAKANAYIATLESDLDEEVRRRAAAAGVGEVGDYLLQRAILHLANDSNYGSNHILWVWDDPSSPDTKPRDLDLGTYTEIKDDMPGAAALLLEEHRRTHFGGTN